MSEPENTKQGWGENRLVDFTSQLVGEHFASKERMAGEQRRPDVWDVATKGAAGMTDVPRMRGLAYEIRDSIAAAPASAAEPTGDAAQAQYDALEDRIFNLISEQEKLVERGAKPKSAAPTTVEDHVEDDYDDLFDPFEEDE